MSAVAAMGGRVSPRGLLAAASLALCAGGLAITAQGVLVPVEAEVAQVQLNRSFDRDLAANGRAAAIETTAAPKPSVRPAIASISAPRLLPAPAAQAKSVAAARPVVAQPIAAHSAAAMAVAPGKPLARITVARLGVRDVILAGEPTHDALAKGPMMVKRGDAASPVTVLAAHRDTHFLFVRDLREGDVVTLQYVTGEVQRYRVTWFETVRWDEFAYPLDPPRPLLALTTCYPFGGTEYGGPLRRVAWAEAI